jgi:two-component system, chemotaxis family, sensor kinase Cph1
MPMMLPICDDESLHSPGAIQPHGALLVCDLASLQVIRLSANVAEFFGSTPEQLLGQPLVLLFQPADRNALLEWIHQANTDHCAHRVTSARGTPLDAAIHLVSNLVIIEVEKAGEATRAIEPLARRPLVRAGRASAPCEAAERATHEVRAFCGFDRVVVYRFDADGNARVIAESKRDDLEPLLGLHCLASDIPAQARHLCLVNKQRMIADVACTKVPLVPSTFGDEPLDLIRASLRSASTRELACLANLGVSSSLSHSLELDGVLIGLIVCLHYSGPRIPARGVRARLQQIARDLALELGALERAELTEKSRSVKRCEAELTKALAGTDDLLGALASEALCTLTRATGAAVVLAEGTRTVGAAPDATAMSELVAWLRSRPEDVFATDRLAEHIPDAKAWDSVGAGVVAATVSRELGEYLIWFRPATERTIEWAGLRRETVTGHSTPWEAWQLEAASDVRRLLLGGSRRRIAVLRSLNQNLAEADRAKDLFIATISHELRNPLSAIAGWSRLYLDGSLPVERRDDVVRIVSRNAVVLGNLVDDLLDTSRMLAGNLSLELENVELPALIESVVMSMAVATDAKGLRVKTRLDNTAGAILGDSVRLRQIVSNLLSNAIKFTPKGGSILVTLSRIGSDVELLVRDTGIGLERASVERIFETFWQVDSSTMRKEKGLGLGLSIVKRLVELHGGDVSVASAGLGHGTTFRVVLPAASTRFAQPHPPTHAPPSELVRERVLEGVCVLLVEDQEDSRTLVREILERAGAVVVAQASAPVALASLETRSFDVIVSDVGMPEMDGFELIASVRNHRSQDIAQLPAVALTAYGRSVERTKVLRAGFQAHVPKPADADELVTVVRSVMNRP